MSEMYGPGGYEIVLADQPIESRDSLWVQLFDLSGNPLSELIYVDTVADCGQNLILLNYSQMAAMLDQKTFLPTISR